MKLKGADTVANDYDDIINMEHPTSKKHPRMSMYARAAQFSPFAALTGHDAAIAETARLTDKMIELSEEQLNDLNFKLGYLMDNIKSELEVTITHFVPDNKKIGGRYDTVTGVVRRIDEYEGYIEFKDKSKYAISNILILESDMFPENEVE